MTGIDRFLEAVGVVAIVLAILYRREIAWAYRNRETLQTVANAAGAVDEVRGWLQ